MPSRNGRLTYCPRRTSPAFAFTRSRIRSIIWRPPGSRRPQPGPAPPGWSGPGGGPAARAVPRLLLAIGRPVVVEEAMARLGIHVELVGLAVLLEFLLVLGHLLRGWALVLRAKEAQERAREVLGVVDRGNGLLGGELFLRHHHTPTPAVHGRVKALHTTRDEKRVSAPRTGAEDTHLTVDVRKRAQVPHGPFNIADRLVVRNAASRPHFGPHIFWRPMAVPGIKVGRNRRIPMVGELAGGLPVPFIPAGCVVDRGHAGAGV